MAQLQRSMHCSMRWDPRVGDSERVAPGAADLPRPGRRESHHSRLGGGGSRSSGSSLGRCPPTLSVEPALHMTIGKFSCRSKASRVNEPSLTLIDGDATSICCINRDQLRFGRPCCISRFEDYENHES
jgi:hypothetical protein